MAGFRCAILTILYHYLATYASSWPLFNRVCKVIRAPLPRFCAIGTDPQHILSASGSMPWKSIHPFIHAFTHPITHYTSLYFGPVQAIRLYNTCVTLNTTTTVQYLPKNNNNTFPVQEEVYICSSRLGLINMDHHHSGNGRNSQQEQVCVATAFRIFCLHSFPLCHQSRRVPKFPCDSDNPRQSLNRESNTTET